MSRTRTLEEVSRLSREERRRLRVGRYRVKGHRREKRRRLSRDELIDYLRRNDFQTWRRLSENRRPGDPMLWDYRKKFGSWSKAKAEAFGKEAFDAEVTVDYLVKLVVKYGLWTVSDYITARKMRPDIVPSFHHVRHQYRRWGNLVFHAKKADARRILEDYVDLRRRLGRDPTAKECHANEVDVQRLVNLFGGRKFLNQNIKSMEKEYERRK